MSDSVTKRDQKQLDDEWRKLLFGVRRSIRYHTRRRSFFDFFHRFTNAIGVIFGSATLFILLNKLEDQLSPAITAALVTAFSTIDLVVGTASAARLHYDLSRQFIELECQMELAAGPIDAQSLARFRAHRLKIEGDEPPVLRVLDAMCHNELARAMGYEKKYFARIRFYQRWLAHFFDVQEHNIKTYGEWEREKSKRSSQVGLAERNPTAP